MVSSFRFRDLGVFVFEFSSFGCFVLRSSFSSASFSKLPSDDMVTTGQEMFTGKNSLQGRGKIREFVFESGKTEVFERSQVKVKF